MKNTIRNIGSATFLVVTLIITSLAFAACGKSQEKEAKDDTATKMEELKKDMVKETRELGQAVKDKAEEVKAEASPEIQKLKDATIQKLNDAKAAIHEATEPTPMPNASSTPVPVPMR